MADIFAGILLAAADQGLSGHSVRGLAESGTPEDAVEAVATASPHGLEETIRHASELISRAIDLTGKAIGQAVDVASDKAFEAAANVGPNIATQGQNLGQSSFSWSGYLQAIGILFLLLALLWFAVWLIRKYGRFNFLPRPGALPKGALRMEAQMPLGPRKGLMVVRFLNRRLLLGVTEHQISLLTEDNAQNERQEKDFKGIMDVARAASDDSGTRDVSS